MSKPEIHLSVEQSEGDGPLIILKIEGITEPQASKLAESLGQLDCVLTARVRHKDRTIIINATLTVGVKKVMELVRVSATEWLSQVKTRGGRFS